MNRRVITIIASDHAHMKRFLAKVRAKAQTGFFGRDEDYEIIRRSLALHADYLTQVHHEVENVLFRQLAKVKPTMLPTLNDLSQEHDEIKGLLSGFLLQGQGYTERTQSWIELELRQVHKYVDQSLAHLSKEENRILSTLDDAFTAADWVIVNRLAEEIYVTAMDGKHH